MKEKDFLLASDFDQTLSFNDSGFLLSELLGVTDFQEKVEGLSQINLVQQGAELSYLILHDPAFRKVRRDHLTEVGKRVRLKKNVPLFVQALNSLAEGYKFEFYVISAAPEEVVVSALEGILPSGRIFGTRFRYDAASGEIESIIRAPAGYGKVAVLEELRTELGVSHDRVIYIGDGRSDLPVMMHVNQHDGLTIAVSENRYITHLAHRTVLSDDALGALVPILEGIFKWDSAKIRRYFASYGLMLKEWDKTRTDWLTIEEAGGSNEHAAANSNTF
jgi:HAD superfamily phosphoserine phosphatase-like hydrolase